MDVRFRPLTLDDLPLLHRWLNDPDIVRWWEGEDVSTLEAVTAKYSPRIAGTERSEQWLASDGDRPIGWLQTYALADWPGYAAACWAVGVAHDAGGLDYFLGEPADRDHGVGPVVIRAFVDEVVFGRHPWPQACAGPHPENVRSWRALEKAGFHCVATIDTENGPERLMVVDRTIRP